MVAVRLAADPEAARGPVDPAVAAYGERCGAWVGCGGGKFGADDCPESGFR